MRIAYTRDETGLATGWRYVEIDYVAAQNEFTLNDAGYNVSLDSLSTPEALAARDMMQVRRILTAAVQTRLDSVAVARGYDSGISLVSYRDDPFPRFASDAALFVTWRSQVWQYCNTVLADVLAGNRSVPTVESLLAEVQANCPAPTFEE